MKQVQIKSFNGDSFPFLLPDSGDNHSFFAFSLHKAGSTLLFNLLVEAMGTAKIPVVDLPKAAFGQGQREVLLDDSINRVFDVNGYAYLGWRFFPYTTHLSHRCLKNIW